MDNPTSQKYWYYDVLYLYLLTSVTFLHTFVMSFLDDALK